jgi:hypothetical protein
MDLKMSELQNVRNFTLHTTLISLLHSIIPTCSTDMQFCQLQPQT